MPESSSSRSFARAGLNPVAACLHRMPATPTRALAEHLTGDIPVFGIDDTTPVDAVELALAQFNLTLHETGDRPVMYV